MRVTRRHRLSNLIQSGLLLAGMALAAYLATYAIAGAQAGLAVALGSLTALLLAPHAPKSAALRLYRARALSPRVFPEGAALMRALAERAGLPRAPELYYCPSAAPNAFAVGTPNDSAVCVSDGLLRLLSLRELAGVLAHEVSHIAHRDLWLMQLADGMSRIATLMSFAGQILLVISLPLLLMGQTLVSWWAPLAMILAPMLATLLQLALSRTREFAADLGAAELTRDPLALAFALGKLERLRGGFWAALPTPAGRIPEPSLLRTHPPSAERIARLRAYAADHPRTAPIETREITAPIALQVVRRPPRLHWSGVWY